MRSVWADIESLDNRVAADVQYGMFYPHQPPAASHQLLAAARARQEPAHRRRGARAARRRRGSSIDSIDSAHRRRRARAARRGARRAERPAACRKSWRGASRGCRCSNRRSTSWRWRAPSACRSPTWRAPTSSSAWLLGLDWLHGEIDRLAVDGSWQATARTGLRDAAMRAHRELTQQVLRHARREARRRAPRALERAARRRARRAGSARSPRCAPWAARISPRSPWASTRCAACRAAEVRMRLALAITTLRAPRRPGRRARQRRAPARRARGDHHRRRRLGRRHAGGDRQRSPRARALPVRWSRSRTRVSASRACATSASPPRRRTTWCSSMATCCCTRNSSPITCALARRGFFTQGVRVHADAALTRELIADAGALPVASVRRARRPAPRSIYCTRRCARDADAPASPTASSPSSPATWASGATTSCASMASTRTFVGWGPEDKELCARLENAGVRRQTLLFGGIACHLHHAPASRAALPANLALLADTRRERRHALRTRSRRTFRSRAADAQIE